uniref:S1 motif domain-containing protein n=1 Tax=Kalanchoe fedtschenkoi TaxID=63787 RepID=A0A7N1A9A1_KALFE
MDSALVSTTSPLSVTRSFSTSPYSSSPPTRRLSFFFRSAPTKFLLFASKGDDVPKLDQWELMELKFGRMIGEDPKLTLAKIMGKRLNPDASALDIEKSFYKNKGKLDIEEVPFNAPTKLKSSVDSQVEVSLDASKSSGALNLMRPVPKKGVQFTSQVRPVLKEIKKPNTSAGDASAIERPARTIPNVILRKPGFYKEDDSENAKLERLNMSIKPNLNLKMVNEINKEQFTDMTLLRKPTPMSESVSSDQLLYGDRGTRQIDEQQPQEISRGFTMSKKPERVSNVDYISDENPSIIFEDAVTIGDDLRGSSSQVGDNFTWEDTPTTGEFQSRPESEEDSFSEQSRLKEELFLELQAPTKPDVGYMKEEAAAGKPPGTKLTDDSAGISIEETLHGKPKRMDQSLKETASPKNVPKGLGNTDSNSSKNTEFENIIMTSPLKEQEEVDWARAEDLIRTSGRADVELISSSTRGFVVSFGSLIGFLPYRNLAAKWKFLAFESWLRRKGLDPSQYRQSLGIIRGNDAANANPSFDVIHESDIDLKTGCEVNGNMSLEDLLQIYDQEKIKFLSSFIGQKIKVNVLLANKRSRKLIFSVKPREKEELIEKKRNLMAKLSVGDVVKCVIKKVTYLGIFVEVDGVPALIHQTEVSWDSTLDPTSMYKIGQVVEAKVHQLDFALERIFLSLKEITPDPLIEALESVVGEQGSLERMVEPAEPATEWADVDSLIRELEQMEGVQSVSKGRYFLSPGLAPTFQGKITESKQYIKNRSVPEKFVNFAEWS